MNKNTLVSSIITGLLFFVLGGGLGVLYQTQQAPPSPQLEKATATIKSLSSKTVPSIIAYGQVTKIEGKDITISYSGDSIKVSMEDNSSVYAFVNDGPEKSGQKKVEFKEIKIGDNLNITLKLLPDGQLQGQQIFILLPLGAPIKAK